MRVEDAMTKMPKACGPNTNLAAATELMWANDCGSLPVLDDAGKVTGIVTDRDMLIALGTRNQRPAELTVGKVMSSPVATCQSGDEVESALSTMRDRKIRRLPVVNDSGSLVGILTMNDIVLHSNRKGGKESDVPYDNVMAAFKAICDHGQVLKQQAALA
jgi:CBS domain-containing protein